MAAIEYRGLNAVTNFNLSRYIKLLRPKPEGGRPANAAVDDGNPSFLGSASTQPPHLRQQQNPEPVAAATTTHAASVTRADVDKSSTAALGLLLQASKLREMLARTATSEVPSPGLELGIKTQPRCSFPADIQTYFECHDNGGFLEGDGTLFGEVNAFETPIFQCELNV